MEAAVRASRPSLLPRPRWARLALALLVVFALLRSVVWASHQPAWFAPDEDYHWDYIEYLVTQHTFPSLDKPFATGETFAAITLSHQGEYAVGPRTSFSGKPHAVVAEVDRLRGSTREPTGERPRQVLHAPLYHLGGAVVDRALGGRSAITRLIAVRYYSAILGALVVFFAWLLAAQVLSRTWQQLAVAAVVATQPILAFSSSTVGNDVAVAASFTAALAWLAFLLRSEPSPRQGIGLGLVLAVALLCKSTAVALLPLAALALLLVWRTWPGRARAVLGIAGWASGILAVGAGWWYVRTYVVAGSPLGQRGALAPAGAAGTSRPLSDAPTIAWQWIGQVYRSFWFDYLPYEVRTKDFWFYLPLAVGLVGCAGLVVFVIARRRTLLAPARPQLRQALVLFAGILALTLPFLVTDVRRGLNGAGFFVQAGRFIMPSFAGAAVLLVLGIRSLTADRRRATPVALGVVVAVALVNYGHTWAVWGLERFYGPIKGDWLAAFRRASWDKPEWVGPGWFATLVLLALVCFAAAWAITIRGARRDARGASREAAPQRAGEPEGGALVMGAPTRAQSASDATL